MNTLALRAAAFGLSLMVTTTTVLAHPGHDDEAESNPELLAALQEADESGGSTDSDKTTGQGDLTFKVIYSTADLPEGTAPGINAAHGGFAVDRRPGKGEIYWALPNVGILRVSADLKTVDILPTDDAMKPTNMHNTTIWYEGDAAFLTFPGNDSSKVYTTDIGGKLLNTLDGPTADMEFSERRVERYFDKPENRFVPTDVEVVDEKFYVTTGYSSLDYVLTAEVDTSNGVGTKWNALAFGGKGSRPGMFGTGHGITLAPNGTLTVADRPNAELESFTLGGGYLNTFTLPEGAFPCDIDYQSGYTIVGCLHGKDREKGAPIYLVKEGEVKSTLMIKHDLGLERFQHIHNAVMVERNGTFYVLAQAWNPGGFAILEQVK